MIICHESIVLTQPPLVIFPLAIAIVKCPELYSVIIRSEMSLKSKSVKRPYPEPVKDHQSRQPDPRATKPSSSSGLGWYTSDIHSSFRAAIQQEHASDPHHGRDEGLAQNQGRQDRTEQSEPDPAQRPGKGNRAHINPSVFQFQPGDLARVSEETREAEYRDKPCTYCSSNTTTVRHHHFSTMELRAFARKWTKGDFMCPVCQEFEPTIQSCNTTRKVILTDSTLYGVWNNSKLPKITEHVEIECIVGARVRDLTRALVKNILKYSNRLEIVVIAGINNIGKNDTVASIMEEFREMKEVVKEHSIKHKHNPPSYVSISTLILRPKFCSFSVPRNVPELAEWVPRPGFQDRYDAIKQVNLEVKAMNEAEQLSWINLHMQGVKILKSGPQHKYDTKPGAKLIWREREVFRKLHFTMENKLKIIVYLQNTFKNNAGRATTTTTE